MGTMGEKEHLSLVVCGHLTIGKSTTCGHLIFKQGGISDREMAKLQAMAEEKGKSSFGYAYYLDTCKEERERGVTIQCNTKEFFTDKYHYTIVDAPGHKDYIKNMITGSATADVGMLLVPAEKGGFEAAIAKADAKLGVEEGQTRQHARLLYLLGVEQIIVGINKMDACNWSEDRFKEIKDEFVKMIQMIGYKPKKVPFIPYSGFNGDNLVEKSDKAAWYKGWTANINPKKKVTGFTLVECLNNFIKPPKREPDAPLRLPISNIYNIKGVGQIICGTIEQGTFALEMSLELSPLDSRERRWSPSNSTRRSSSPPDPETLLVCPSRVSPRTRRSTLVTLSTSRRRVNSCPSRLSPPWLPSRSTLVPSRLVTVLSSSLVLPRLLAK